MSEVVKQWREVVGATNKKSGQSLADPVQYENLFPEFVDSLVLEKFQNEFGFEHSTRLENIPVDSKTCNLERNLQEEMETAVSQGLWKPGTSKESIKPLLQDTNVPELQSEANLKRKDSLDIMDEIEREIDEMALDETANSEGLLDEEDLIE